MAQPTYDPLYLRGIEHFNRQDFFDSHESWEELWMREEGASKGFYKGMIQAAVALLHYRNGNALGARKLLLGSQAYLAPYRPKYMGLDIDQLLNGLSRCLAPVLGPDGPPPIWPPKPNSTKWDPALVPEIRLDPAPDGELGIHAP